MVFYHHRIDILGEKVIEVRIIVSAPVPVPFLWTLDFRVWTWIWDLGLGLDNFLCPASDI